MFLFKETEIDHVQHKPNKPKTSKRGQAKAELPETAVGFCSNNYCGVVLFDDPADVPPGWILVWHINCGGYCPECALELSPETLLIYGIDPAAQSKARLVLDTIPASASNPKEDDDDDKNDNDSDDDDNDDEWADF